MRRSIVVRILKGLLLASVLVLLLAGMVWRWIFYAPGASYAGIVHVSEGEPLVDELKSHVTALAGDIGQRGTFDPPALQKSSRYLQDQLKSLGYTPAIQTYQASGVDCDNIEAEIPGSVSPQRIFVIGAHYDTVPGTGGANDNTSGVAAVLALARSLKDAKPAATLRFVVFVNEEPPHFQTPRMGSMVYAKRCKDRGEKVIGMFSLETIGYYSDAPNSQRYPSPFDKVYPTTGNFIAFVANPDSRLLMHSSIDSFRKHCQFPSEGGAVPDMAPGIGWSDHWSFWQHGYEALMITDTATFRYPYYHQRADSPDKLGLRQDGQRRRGSAQCHPRRGEVAAPVALRLAAAMLSPSPQGNRRQHGDDAQAALTGDLRGPHARSVGHQGLGSGTPTTGLPSGVCQGP